MPAPETVWPCLSYKDAPAAIRFLIDAFGFEETLAVPDESDSSVIHHAELRWPAGGAIMLGSATKKTMGTTPVGGGACYAITDEPTPCSSGPWPPGTRSCLGWPTRTRVAWVHRAGPRGQPLDVRHLPGRVIHGSHETSAATSNRAR